ncbi:MAG: DUF2924 domain-containing protein [Afipia sp.]
MINPSVHAASAELQDLDVSALHKRWRRMFGHDAPGHVTRQLLLSVLSHRVQADQLGDLDRQTKKLLDQITPADSRESVMAKLVAFDRSQVELRPGTLLTREWNNHQQRVMVTAEGFAWNGSTYASLSEVAFAITGTRWNGPRFFGLRDKKRSTDPSGADP